MSSSFIPTDKYRAGAPQQRPGFPGSPRDQFGGYGAPGRDGYTWGPDADNRFMSENPIDPSTGLPSGPGAYGLIPAGIALQYQAAHDRKIWEMRQRMMRGGLNYGRGALNLLQSFRPGGGAAIESGIYGGLANLKFNQAQLTEPLDLLGDWRREQESRSRMRTNRQMERQMVIQGIGTAAAIGLAPATGGASLLALGGLNAAAGAYGAYQNRKAAEAGARGRQDGFEPATAGGGFQPIGPGGAAGIDPDTGGVPGGVYGPPAPTGGAGGGGAAQATMRPDQPGQPQGMGGQQGQQPGGTQDQPGQAGGQPGAGGMGMGAPATGADGNFTPTSYAANGAASAVSPLQNVIMMKQLADSLEADPFFETFSDMVNMQLAERISA